MSKHIIKKYSTYSSTKACINIEGFNRTFKSLMYKEFTHRGSHNWITILPMLIKKYNNLKHRNVGMTPSEADYNPMLITLKQRSIENNKIKFKLNDKVRISTYL